MIGAIVVSLALLVPASSVEAASSSYSLAPTVRCLAKADAKVTRVRRGDSRRIAFSDLAQRTSREARFGRRSVLLAFTQGASNAALLREALVVPDDPYVLSVRRNVVLMYRPADATAFRRAAACLRPR